MPLPRNTIRNTILGLGAMLAMVGAPPALATPPANHPITSESATPTGSTDAQWDPAVVANPADGTQRLLLASSTAPGKPLGAWHTSACGSGCSSSWQAVWTTGTVPTVSGVSPALPAVAWNSGSGGVDAVWQGTSSANGVCDAASGIYYAQGSASTGNFATSALVQRPATTVSVTWPSLTYDAATAGPVLAASYTDYGANPCDTQPLFELTRLYSGANYGGLPGPVAYNAYFPDVVSVPGRALPTVAVAYLEAGGGPVHIAVSVCTFGGSTWGCPNPTTGGVDVSGPITQLATVTLPGGATVPAVSAPRIAVASDGTLRVVWAALAASGQSRVYYTQSTDPAGGQWTAAGELTAGGANQWEPSIAVDAANSRADVVYLDTRDAVTKQYAAFQTSVSASGLRGGDIQLVPDTAPATVSGNLTTGLRASALSLSSSMPPALAYNGHAIGYVTQAGGQGGSGGADVNEAELWHGLSNPSLATPPPTPRSVAKNTAVSISDWLTPLQPDGDPVAVSSQASAGTIDTAGAYHPGASYAGPDTVSVTADDGYRPAVSASYDLLVTNQPPVFTPVAPFVVAEGSSVTLPLSAVDPDVNDPVTFAVASVPPALRKTVSIVGSSLRVAVPNGVRSATALTVVVEARDTTIPAWNAATADEAIVFNIRPALTPTTLPSVTAASNGFTTQFTAAPKWTDRDATCLASTCHWQFVWAFGDGSTLVSTSATVRHTYPRSGWFTATVKATVVGYPDGAPGASGATVGVSIFDDARSQFFVTSTASRGRLAVTVRSHVSTSLLVQVVGGGLTLQRTITVRAGARGTLGGPVRAVFSVRHASARVADLIVRYADALADRPTPLPVRRRIWLF
jgi:hypothetical protein